MPHRLSTLPIMPGAQALCSRVWMEMPWIVVAAPIRAMQMTPTVKEWVETKPAVARVSISPAPSAKPRTRSDP